MAELAWDKRALAHAEAIGWEDGVAHYRQRVLTAEYEAWATGEGEEGEGGVNDCGQHEVGPHYRHVRCDHLGDRFVVEIVNDRTGWRLVDYVERMAGAGVTVEAHHAYDEAGADAEWAVLVAKMERGEPPDPDWEPR